MPDAFRSASLSMGLHGRSRKMIINGALYLIMPDGVVYDVRGNVVGR